MRDTFSSANGIRCCRPEVACCVDSQQIKACAGQLGKDLGIVPSTVSHRSKQLHQAGLIRMERRGQNMDCWVNPETVQGLGKFFSKLQFDQHREIEKR